MVISSLNTVYFGRTSSSELMDSPKARITLEPADKNSEGSDGKIDSTFLRKPNIESNKKIVVNNPAITDTTEVRNNAEVKIQTANENKKVEKITLISFFIKCIALLFS